jgi:hypothetical protein
MTVEYQASMRLQEQLAALVARAKAAMPSEIIVGIQREKDLVASVLIGHWLSGPAWHLTGSTTTWPNSNRPG